MSIQTSSRKEVVAGKQDACEVLDASDFSSRGGLCVNTAEKIVDFLVPKSRRTSHSLHPKSD